MASQGPTAQDSAMDAATDKMRAAAAKASDGFSELEDALNACPLFKYTSFNLR